MTLAFGLQSYAVQTHIHEQLDLPAIAKTVTAAAIHLADAKAGKTKLPAKAPLPTKESPTIARSASFSMAGNMWRQRRTDSLFAHGVGSAIETELGAPPHYDAVSHSWRGRAPPRH